MTRQEFIDEVTMWSELIDFCYNENINFCNDVYSEDEKDDYFNNELVEMARKADDWRDLQSRLEDIPDGCYYYINDDYGGFRGADDDDFDDHKDDILEYMDDNEYWDDEEEEEVEEEPAPDDEDPEDEEPVEEEDVSIAELFATCNSKLQKIDADTEAAARAAEEEDEEAFNDFCAEVGVTVTVEIKGGNA